MTDAELLKHISIVQHVYKKVMQKDVHFMVIPGTKKPTLLKDGAEKLALVFNLSGTYEIERLDLPGGHREYEVVCTLTHTKDGHLWGQGLATCTTMESRYRWRKGELTCPQCGKQGAMRRGKRDQGGGWYCWDKLGGCRLSFKDDDERMTSQSVERTENPDLADQYNTVKKMARKRAYVDAVLTCTAASDIFTQDLDDRMNGGPPTAQAAVPESHAQVGKTQAPVPAAGPPSTAPGPAAEHGPATTPRTPCPTCGITMVPGKPCQNPACPTNTDSGTPPWADDAETADPQVAVQAAVVALFDAARRAGEPTSLTSATSQRTTFTTQMQAIASRRKTVEQVCQLLATKTKELEGKVS